MSEWLQTYNEFFGMYHAGIITSIFGAFAVTFTVLMSWPEMSKGLWSDRWIYGSGPYYRNFLGSRITNCPVLVSPPGC